MKTKKQCKDEVAKNNGQPHWNWETLCRNSENDIRDFVDEVMDIYADQFRQPNVSGNTRLHLPEIKKKTSEAVLLAEEYDYIIGVLNHGTSYIGITERERIRHDRIIDWLKKRRDDVKASKTDH